MRKGAGDVSSRHLTDLSAAPPNVRCWGKTGKNMLAVSISALTRKRHHASASDLRPQSLPKLGERHITDVPLGCDIPAARYPLQALPSLRLWRQDRDHLNFEQKIRIGKPHDLHQSRRRQCRLVGEILRANLTEFIGVGVDVSKIAI